MVQRISKTEVNRAGDRLRALITDSQVLSAQDLYEMYSCLVDFRAGFQQPLNKVVMGLRSFVKTELGNDYAGGKLPVGQRLKREPQIEKKLLQFPKMKLARMQDIGGCRAILPKGDVQVANVLDRIERQWGSNIKHLKDYREASAATGYRAVHVVVSRDGHLIEIQLRTPGQHAWAGHVEQLELETRFNLKDNEGPSEVLAYLWMASEGVALEEGGQIPDKNFMAEFHELRETARSLVEEQ